MDDLKKIVRHILSEKFVLGYIKPERAFRTLDEWDEFVTQMLRLQKKGFDTRGGGQDLNRQVKMLVDEYFGFQLKTEVERYDLLTYKNIMDFVEDFVNHKFWGLEREFGHYFPNFSQFFSNIF